MAQSAIHEAKKVLRRELKKRISAMTSETKRAEARAITEKLLAMDEYRSSQRISVYLSMPSEVNTDDILKDLFQTQRACFIPRYVGPRMDMVKLDSLEDMLALPLTSWNIRQPADDDPREEALSTGGLELIIVPGLGFTRQGLRLGRGKGYYDSYIKKCIETSQRKPYLVGLAFSEQMCAELPVTDHDMQLDHVLFCETDPPV